MPLAAIALPLDSSRRTAKWSIMKPFFVFFLRFLPPSQFFFGDKLQDA